METRNTRTVSLAEAAAKQKDAPPVPESPRPTSVVTRTILPGGDEY